MLGSLHSLVLVSFLLATLLCFTAADLPVYKLTEYKPTPNGFEGTVELIAGSGPYGGDIKQLSLKIFMETEDRLRVKITDKNSQRWEVPTVVISETPNVKPAKTHYDIQVENQPFGFTVRRLTDNKVIFNTTKSTMVYSDQYIEFTSTFSKEVASQPNGPNVYGLGERVRPFRLDNQDETYTMWNRDHYEAPDKNYYGTHPFYLELLESTNSAHGVFFLNSNAMDVVLGRNTVQFKTIGGVIDLFFFMGPTPEQVVQQYQQVVGTPQMIPYWSLGFMQSRWGYQNAEETMAVVDNFRKNKIPLDVMFNDIDYMDHYKCFTFDPKSYPVDKMKQFVDDLHNNGQKYVVIVDPGIKIEKGYEAYEEGLKRNIFMFDNDGKTPYTGIVWPGSTHFPDFSNPNAVQYWQDMLQGFINQVPVDGIWIDMNEISSFQTHDDTKRSTKTKSGFDPVHPPFIPGGDKLEYHTVTMDSIMNVSISYNSHSLYAFYEGIATRQALENIRKKRAFVLTRSSFAGNGRVCSKWLGDNVSTFKSMAESIPGIINMNMFGVAMIGADICGFGGNTTEELCTRWMQLGSFYPFSRNHNTQGAKPQEPYAFSQKLTDISRAYLLNRYSILPYYYSLFFKVHTQGGTLIKSLMFEYPEDPNTRDIDTQFLVGPALLISPVLEEGAKTVKAYIPKDVYYDYYSGKKLDVAGSFVTLQAPIEHINVHVRGGYIIPKQVPGLTTEATRKQPFQILAALNSNGVADGFLFIDDGDSLHTILSQQYSHIYMSAQVVKDQGILQSRFVQKGFDLSGKTLNQITVYGVSSKPYKVSVRDQPNASFKYDDDNKVLVIDGFAHPMTMELFAAWYY